MGGLSRGRGVEGVFAVCFRGGRGRSLSGRIVEVHCCVGHGGGGIVRFGRRFRKAQECAMVLRAIGVEVANEGL